MMLANAASPDLPIAVQIYELFNKFFLARIKQEFSKMKQHS